MTVVDISCLGIVVIGIILGGLFGFGKSLRFLTSGIFGIIIGVVVCVMFGGLFFPFFTQTVEKFEADLINTNAFFQYIYLGHVIYYLILFIIVQIIRKIIVSIISGMTESDATGVRVTNKIFGAIFTGVFCSALVLLFFATVKMFSSAEFIKTLVETIESSKCSGIYENNLIVF